MCSALIRPPYAGMRLVFYDPGSDVLLLEVTNWMGGHSTATHQLCDSAAAAAALLSHGPVTKA